MKFPPCGVCGRRPKGAGLTCVALSPDQFCRRLKPSEMDAGGRWIRPVRDDGHVALDFKRWPMHGMPSPDCMEIAGGKGFEQHYRARADEAAPRSGQGLLDFGGSA